MAAHSYSSISQFLKCQHQYHQVRVLKRFKYIQSAEAVEGERVHALLEKAARARVYIDDSPRLNEVLDKYVYIRDNPYDECMFEYDFSLLEDGSKVPPNRWDIKFWNGKADVLGIRGITATVVDYKTGSNKYPDKLQLELMALLTFLSFPQITDVEGVLAFITHNTEVREAYRRSTFKPTFDKLYDITHDISLTASAGTWSMNPTALCGWCDVTDCPHWHNRKKT